ncbi:glycoside hydrolase family 65 protein [Hoyosella sp. YIM 151337]|uniref:glycoside hydrolase family 65 protein n=1 Tax=Hoyosella sp. YIM 151337 TaxID=2992742 RepID=UPI00223681E7|nr:glycosyl hydrolase family 65 protein [Hoyosella sp. YIM 151337]MCW4355004.1 glycoside hydrolase family 65 protein [Hoyosella sp. YIM 151337]
MLHNYLSTENWLITESGFSRGRANYHETVFTIGNGRLGTRGSFEEGHQGELSGTFLAGVYDSHDSPVIDLVNAPDWLGFVVTVGGVRMDIDTCSVVTHERALDIRHGVLWRKSTFRDSLGRETTLETIRFASMADRRLCVLRAEVTADNHEAEIVVESSIDGRRRNLERKPAYPPGTKFAPEIKWEKWAKTNHLAETGRLAANSSIHLGMRTISSGIDIGYSAATETSVTPRSHAVREQHARIADVLTFTPAAGETIRLDKFVSIVTSRDNAAVYDSCQKALAAHRAAGFDAVLADSKTAWTRKWDDCDTEIVGDAEATKAMRFNAYQLLIAVNEDDPTVSIGAKSLSGEGYRGHIFWDTEILMLPFFIYTQPDAAKALLRYRYHTLDGARIIASKSGFRGARYAWESADSGREECPQWTADGRERLWMGEEELHITADVAYGVLTYVAATGDTEFLADFGAEIVFETSRYWADCVTWSRSRGAYELNSVIGPDEFHSHVDNNAYTNALVRWQFGEALRIYRELQANNPEALARIADKIELTAREVEQWGEIASLIAANRTNNSGVIEQFDGYFDRTHVPITMWDDNNMPQYPEGYHHFNCEDTDLLKQPDVVMLMYLLPDQFALDAKRANFDYYEARTLHKSSLSPAIHAIMGIEVGDHTRALQYFTRSAFVDLADNQGNTHEGIHAASAGGTWQAFVSGFGGFRVMNGTPTFNPWLPPEWDEIRFRLRWRGSRLSVSVRHSDMTLQLDASPETRENVMVQGQPIELTAGIPCTVELQRSERAERAHIGS